MKNVNTGMMQELPSELPRSSVPMESMVDASDKHRTAWDIPGVSPKNIYVPLSLAASLVAAKAWRPSSEKAAQRKLKEIEWDHLLDGSPAYVYVATFWERPRVQRKIDVLLNKNIIPLYEWPSRIRTDETEGAYVNEAELVALLMAGAHLCSGRHESPGSRPVAPTESHSGVRVSATAVSAPDVTTSTAGAGDSGESQKGRQARRYQMCIDAGLSMPDNDYAPLPRGVGKIAKSERITRQAFAEDVKAHIRRINGR